MYPAACPGLAHGDVGQSPPAVVILDAQGQPLILSNGGIEAMRGHPRMAIAKRRWLPAIDLLVEKIGP
jgi:hypothetical protein